jgi:GDP-mannose 6-dehydrogenase
MANRANKLADSPRIDPAADDPAARPRAGAPIDDLLLKLARAEAELRGLGVERPRVSVLGLGYVGTVLVACLGRLGYRVTGVDVLDARVDAVNAGISPMVEPKVGELLGRGTALGLIRAAKDAVAAVRATDVTMVCVGTPVSADGDCELGYVREAARAVGRGLARKDDYHVVALRCSVPPGTTMSVLVPEIEAASGKELGVDFGVCFNPEFLREGCAVDDFFRPPRTVIGATDERAAHILAGIYAGFDANIVQTGIAEAEMLKYVDNTWHGLKVAFANEIGRLCKAAGVDSHEVMDVFVRDRKLNLSACYLQPGFAFGGSCLPKEIRAMEHLAGRLGVETPVIGRVLASNRCQIDEALELIERIGRRRLGFLGVAFKDNTDDLRGSPVLDLMAAALASGYTLAGYDPNVGCNAAVTAQAAHIAATRPDLRPLIERLPVIMETSADAVVERADVLVVSHATELFRRIVDRRPTGMCVVDLVRLFRHRPVDPHYHGICW